MFRFLVPFLFATDSEGRRIRPECVLSLAVSRMFYDLMLQVFERGLKAIPLSVDLWLHYINFQTTEFSNEEDAEAKLRKYGCFLY